MKKGSINQILKQILWFVRIAGLPTFIAATEKKTEPGVREQKRGKQGKILPKWPTL